MQQQTFKKGDKVMRMGNSYPEANLYEGEVYTVERVSDEGRYLHLEEVTREYSRWEARLFKKVNKLPDWF